MPYVLPGTIIVSRKTCSSRWSLVQIVKNRTVYNIQVSVEVRNERNHGRTAQRGSSVTGRYQGGQECQTGDELYLTIEDGT